MPKEIKESANRVGQINSIQDQQSTKISITTIQNLKNTDGLAQVIDNDNNSTQKDNRGSVYLSGFPLKIGETLSETSNEDRLSSESHGTKSDKDEENQQQSFEQAIGRTESLCLSDNTSSLNSVKKQFNTFGKKIT
jgi:hypothetical protein